MRKVRVKFFGAFRKYIPTGESEVEIEKPLSAAEFRQVLQSYLDAGDRGFNERSLIAESALANEDFILQDSDVIDGHALIAVLPPVCGG